MNRIAGLLDRENLPLLLILLGALVFRMAWILVVEPPGTNIYPDMKTYDRMARLLVESGTFAHQGPNIPTAISMPGYPFLLAVVYFIFGSDPSPFMAVRMLQVFISVVTLLAVYRIGVRLHSKSLGLAAAVLGALYPPFTFVNQQILTEVLFAFLVTVLVLAALRLMDAPTNGNAYLFGIVLALSVLVRPTIVVWGVMPFLLLLRKVSFKRLALLSGLAVVTFCLLMTPWWLRNAAVFDRFVPFTSSSNNPRLVGTYYAMPGENGVPRWVFEWPVGPQAELEKNREWGEVATARLRMQLSLKPWTLVKQRARLTEDALRVPFDQIIWGLPPWVNRMNIRLQELILLLGVVGFVLNYRDRRSWLILSLIAYFVVVHAAIFILNRYLFPVMPLVLLAGAWGAFTIRDRIRAGCIRAG